MRWPFLRGLVGAGQATLGHRPLAWERGTLWAIDDLSAITPVAARCPVRFAELGPDSAAALALVAGMVSPEPILERMMAGKRCFAGWVDGQIAVYGWLSFRSEGIGELERAIHLQERDGYIWDCATAPSFRRRRLYSALLSHIAHTLAGEQMRRLWIGSSRANTPSIRAFDNAGFQPVLDALYIRCLRLRCMLFFGNPGTPPALLEAGRAALTRSDERGWGGVRLGWG